MKKMNLIREFKNKELEEVKRSYRPDGLRS